MPVTINASTSSGLVQTADTSGNIELQSNGSTKATVSSSGLAIGQYNPSTSLITSGTAVASTSGTSITFTSIPNWVKRITIAYSGVSVSGSALQQIQLGTSGGIVSSGYLCSGSYITTGAGANYYTTGFGINNGGSSNAMSGIATLVLLNGSTNTWAMSGTFGLSAGVAATQQTGGAITLSGVLTTVRHTTDNGTDTFDAGTINILYE